jgi:PAS domain S-box-containing protein
MKSENKNTSRAKSSRAISKNSQRGISQPKTQKNGVKGPRKSKSLEGKKSSLVEMKKLAHGLQIQQDKMERQKNMLLRAQVKMKKKLEEHANFYDFAPVVFLTLDEKGRMVSVNQLASVLLGVEKKALIGKKLERFFTFEDQVKFGEYLRSMSRSHVKKVSGILHLKHNHSPHLVRLKSMKTGSAAGESTIAYQMVLIDLTEREQEKQAQHQQAEWMLSILEHAMDAIITIDEQQRIVQFNQAAEQMFHCSAREAIGQRIEGFLPQRFRKGHQKHIREFSQSQVTNRRMGSLGRVVGLRDDGEEFPAEASISQAVIEGKKLFTVILRDTSERDLKEHALQWLSQQHQLILNSAGEGIYGIDSEGHTIFYNPAAEEITQFKGSELRGKLLHTFLHHSKPDGSLNRWEGCPVFQSLTTGKSQRVDYEIFWRKDGSSFPAEYSTTPMVTETGKIDGAVVSFRDISERKRTEERLSENEALLNEAQHIAHVGNWNWDIPKNTLYWSKEIYNIFGLRPQEFGVSYESFLESVHPRDREMVKKAVHATLYEQELYSIDHRIVRPDGTERVVHEEGKVWKDHQGNPVRMVGTVQDITDRKQTEEKIQESEKRLQMMVEHLPAGAVFTDGHVLVFNKAMEILTGYSRTEVTTLAEWFRMLHGPDEPMVKKMYLKDKHAGFVMPRLLPIRRKDGKIRFVEFTAYGWEKGEVWLLHDLTDQHESQHALLESKHALEENQKELQTLAGKLLTAQEDERRRISRELHDDMNQRMAVLAFKIQTLQGQINPGNAMTFPLEEIHDDVASLSDELRRLAYQLHPSILEDMGLPIALRSLADDITRREGVNITIQQDDLPASLPFSHTVCLYRVCQEGLRNSIKHGCAKSATLTIKVVDGGVSLCIEDTGKGFDPDDQALKRSGIGLVGMQERVRLVGGTLTVRSCPGHGTELCAWVPLSQEVT